MPSNKLSKEFKDRMRYFIQDHSPERISKHLRIVFLDYLKMQNIGLPTDFDNILNDVEALFDLLDVIAEEKKDTQHV